MTDNIITKDEAIDRMKAGLPCETWSAYLGGGEWRKTEWDDFTDAHKFRKPPEPRRVAREWWICDDGYCISNPPKFTSAVHVREVLPGDVTLDPMTEGQVFQLAKQCEVSTPVAERICRALGLIGEGA